MNNIIHQNTSPMRWLLVLFLGINTTLSAQNTAHRLSLYGGWTYTHTEVWEFQRDFFVGPAYGQPAPTHALFTSIAYDHLLEEHTANQRFYLSSGIAFTGFNVYPDGDHVFNYPNPYLSVPMLFGHEWQLGRSSRCRIPLRVEVGVEPGLYLSPTQLNMQRSILNVDAVLGVATGWRRFSVGTRLQVSTTPMRSSLDTYAFRPIRLSTYLGYALLQPTHTKSFGSPAW